MLDGCTALIVLCKNAKTEHLSLSSLSLHGVLWRKQRPGRASSWIQTILVYLSGTYYPHFMVRTDKPKERCARREHRLPGTTIFECATGCTEYSGQPTLSTLLLDVSIMRSYRVVVSLLCTGQLVCRSRATARGHACGEGSPRGSAAGPTAVAWKPFVRLACHERH